MNIKINIKDCDCEPTVITKKEISEVEFKKKNMLYAPPTKDNKSLKTSKKINTPNQTNVKQPVKNYPLQQAQRKFLNQMSQISKNQLTNNMMQNSNTILQKQNQIIVQNQRTIHNMLTNPQNQQMNSRQQQYKNQQLKKIFQQSADKIARQIKQIKKVRDQIIQYGESFKRNTNQGKSTNHNLTNLTTGSQKVGQMNSNLKNLVQISKNHIQGLQNLQGIKNLQNFNIQAYTQAINTLKKQIVQYQKQSQNIERELKLRAAKLQKLQISPNFQQQLLQPYEQHLKKKVQSIDLHSIKQKVYQKLGVFDYGKFQNDLCGITNQIKNQMNQFNIICKQFRIQIPDIKIDKKQLKMLDLKLPSVLDQFKSSRGILFNQKTNQDDQKKLPIKKNLTQTNQLSPRSSKERLNQTKNQLKRKPVKQSDFGQIYTKPVDLSKNTKLTRTNKPERKTVLQTTQQQQRKQVSKNIRKMPQKNQDDDFDKYLQNRAKQQLAAIYEQKRKRLQQMQKQLYNACKQQPQYQLTLNVKNKISPPKKVIKQIVQKQQQSQYGQDFEEQKQISKRQFSDKKPSLSKQNEEIKNIGTQVLRQKLKNLFNKNPALNQPVHQNRLIQQNQMSQVPMNQMASLAEGFVNMINNTLSQVNTQLSQSIQKKMQNRSFSQQKRFEMQRKSPNTITVPKLEQFRAPPVFNMQMVYEPTYNKPEQKKAEKKIIAKNYDYLRIQQDNNELQISSISNED